MTMTIELHSLVYLPQHSAKRLRLMTEQYEKWDRVVPSTFEILLLILLMQHAKSLRAL